MTHIDFHLDFVSPYAYLAFEHLPEVLEGISCEVSYRPVLLGALFKHHGHTPPVALPAKRAGSTARRCGSATRTASRSSCRPRIRTTRCRTCGSRWRRAPTARSAVSSPRPSSATSGAAAPTRPIPGGSRHWRSACRRRCATPAATRSRRSCAPTRPRPSRRASSACRPAWPTAGRSGASTGWRCCARRCRAMPGSTDRSGTTPTCVPGHPHPASHEADAARDPPDDACFAACRRPARALTERGFDSCDGRSVAVTVVDEGG